MKKDINPASEDKRKAIKLLNYAYKMADGSPIKFGDSILSFLQQNDVSLSPSLKSYILKALLSPNFKRAMQSLLDASAQRGNPIPYSAEDYVHIIIKKAGESNNSVADVPQHYKDKYKKKQVDDFFNVNEENTMRSKIRQMVEEIVDQKLEEVTGGYRGMKGLAQRKAAARSAAYDPDAKGRDWLSVVHGPESTPPTPAPGPTSVPGKMAPHARRGSMDKAYSSSAQVGADFSQEDPLEKIAYGQGKQQISQTSPTNDAEDFFKLREEVSSRIRELVREVLSEEFDF